MIAMARSDDAPMTTRFGRMKSSTADPSRRNSGFETTSKATGAAWRARMISATRSPVPTGTVLLVTITL